MACHVAPCRHLPHPYRMSTPGNGCRARTQYRGKGCSGLYSRQIGLTPKTDDRDCRPESCARQTNPLLAILRFFPPVKDMLSLSFPRLAGKPILVLWLCLRTSSLPVLTGMSNLPALVSMTGWTGIPPVSGKKGFPVKRQSVQHTDFPPQEQKQGGASAPPCPYSLVLCRHIRPACPVCYPWVARVWARLWNFSLSTTTRSWVPSPMGPTSS